MNRCFSDDDRQISGAIANFILGHLAPHVDNVLDLHAAGRALIMSSAMLDPRPKDRPGFRRSLGMARAFGADAVLVIDQDEGDAMFDGAILATGKSFVCAEIGSAATLTPESAALAEAGIRRVLDHLGLTNDGSDRSAAPSPLMAIGKDHTVRAARGGFLRPLVAIGADVRAGDPVARVIDPSGAARDEIAYAARPGVIYNIAAGGPITENSFVATIVDPLPPIPADDAQWQDTFERVLPPYVT
jgi:predicted deacylase